jgi:hypothetical protein
MTKADAEKILVSLINGLKLTRQEYETLATAIKTLGQPVKEPVAIVKGE